MGEVFTGTMSMQIQISHIHGIIISPLRGSRLPLGNNHFSIEMAPLRGLDLGLVIRWVALIREWGCCKDMLYCLPIISGYL